MATITRSLGNLRCIASYPCVNGYVGFATWEQGFEAWYNLIANLYVKSWHLVTVGQIVPVYAPSSDHNNVAGYIQAIEAAVSAWRSQK